jgi:hypothetical protein
LLKIRFVSADDDECALKTDTCGVLGPDWICRNTLGSFRCDKKRCVGPNCRVLQGSYNNTNQINRNSSKCLRGYEMDKNNKCTGNYFDYYLFIYFFLMEGACMFFEQISLKTIHHNAYNVTIRYTTFFFLLFSLSEI